MRFAGINNKNVILLLNLILCSLDSVIHGRHHGYAIISCPKIKKYVEAIQRLLCIHLKRCRNDCDEDIEKCGRKPRFDVDTVDIIQYKIFKILYHARIAIPENHLERYLHLLREERYCEAYELLVYIYKQTESCEDRERECMTIKNIDLFDHCPEYSEWYGKNNIFWKNRKCKKVPDFFGFINTEVCQGRGRTRRYIVIYERENLDGCVANKSSDLERSIFYFPGYVLNFQQLIRSSMQSNRFLIKQIRLLGYTDLANILEEEYKKVYSADKLCLEFKGKENICIDERRLSIELLRFKVCLYITIAYIVSCPIGTHTTASKCFTIEILIKTLHQLRADCTEGRSHGLIRHLLESSLRSCRSKCE